MSPDSPPVETPAAGANAAVEIEDTVGAPADTVAAGALATVSAVRVTQSSAFPREALIEPVVDMLREYRGGCNRHVHGSGDYVMALSERLIEEFAALWPKPVSPPTIDPEALLSVKLAWQRSMMSGTPLTNGEFVDSILALIRPADGAVTLTAVETAIALAVFRNAWSTGLTQDQFSAARALLQKLEAAS